MIIGIGSDLSDIRRIQASLERWGERFKNKAFTEIEKRRSDAKPDAAASYAKRFAAKEAMSKALGTGLKGGVHLVDMGVVNQKSGKPTMALTGGAAKRLAALIPPGMEAHIHVSLTDDHPYAQAFVIIEALPAEGTALAAGPSNV